MRFSEVVEVYEFLGDGRVYEFLGSAVTGTAVAYDIACTVFDNESFLLLSLGLLT